MAEDLVNGVNGPTRYDDVSVQYKVPKRVPKQEMDKEAFLALMVTQMRYQDPSSPMDMTAMMQQTAAMSTVEQLMNTAEYTKQALALQHKSAGLAMVGQEILWVDPKMGHQVGKVTGAVFAEDNAVLMVGDQSVKWDTIAATGSAVEVVKTRLDAEAAAKAAAEAAEKAPKADKTESGEGTATTDPTDDANSTDGAGTSGAASAGGSTNNTSGSSTDDSGQPGSGSTTSEEGN